MHKQDPICHSNLRPPSYVSIKAHTAPRRLPLSAQATPPRLSRSPQAPPVTQNAKPRPHRAEARPPRPLMPIYVTGHKPRPLTCHSRSKPRPLTWQSRVGRAPLRSFRAQATPRPVLGLPLAAAPHGARVPSGPARPRLRSIARSAVPVLLPPPSGPARPPYSRGEPQRRGGCLIGREANGSSSGNGALAGREALG